MTQPLHPQQPALSPEAKQQPEVPHLATSALQSIKSVDKNQGACSAYSQRAKGKGQRAKIKESRCKELVLGEVTDAETDAAVAEVRVEAVAVGRAAVPGEADPRPAAQQPKWPPTYNPGSAIRRCPPVRIVPRIQTPFPDIAVHVMQTPGIG
jgi:hypothetical protein